MPLDTSKKAQAEQSLGGRSTALGIRLSQHKLPAALGELPKPKLGMGEESKFMAGLSQK